MNKRTSKDQVLQKKFDELERKNKESLLGGGEKRIEQQHAKGKLTARERLIFCWTKVRLRSWENL